MTLHGNAGSYILGRAMSAQQKSSGCGSGCLVIIVLVFLAAMIGKWSSGPEKPKNESRNASNGNGGFSTQEPVPFDSGTVQKAPPTATPANTPLAPLALGDLTDADLPSSITLKTAVEFPFRVGDTVTVKDKAPVFFNDQYVTDANQGDRFEILKFDPKTLRVFCRSKDKTGRTIAVNIRTTHLTPTSVVTAPAGTTVALNRLDGDSVLVSYVGGSQLVPINETDLLLMAARKRQQNVEAQRQQEAAEREREAQAERQREEAAKQAEAEKEQRKAAAEAVITGQAGDKPQISAWDGSVTAVKTYMEQTLNDPDVKYVAWYEPILKQIDGEYYWIAKVRFRAKNPFGTYMLHDYGYMIQKDQVVKAIDLDAVDTGGE